MQNHPNNSGVYLPELSIMLLRMDREQMYTRRVTTVLATPAATLTTDRTRINMADARITQIALGFKVAGISDGAAL